MSGAKKFSDLLSVANLHNTTKGTGDEDGTTLVNHWQRGVPAFSEPIITPALLFFAALAAVGLTLAVVRFVSPLGPFSGMNDAYAWGIWKTFNVLTLTALGSGPLALGMAAWVFNREKLHIVMRTALVSGFLFYATGLVALGFDVGRAWNFYNILLPWRWNAGFSNARDFFLHASLLRSVPGLRKPSSGSGTLLLYGQRRDQGVPSQMCSPSAPNLSVYDHRCVCISLSCISPP